MTHPFTPCTACTIEDTCHRRGECAGLCNGCVTPYQCARSGCSRANASNFASKRDTEETIQPLQAVNSAAMDELIASSADDIAAMAGLRDPGEWEPVPPVDCNEPPRRSYQVGLPLTGDSQPRLRDLEFCYSCDTKGTCLEHGCQDGDGTFPRPNTPPRPKGRLVCPLDLKTCRTPYACEALADGCMERKRRREAKATREAAATPPRARILREAERGAHALSEEYDALRVILFAALEQSAEGKGCERHANGKPWESQPINTITEAVGIGFPLGQAVKKLTEAAGMLRRGEADAARAELLGAIVYTAAAVHAVESD